MLNLEIINTFLFLLSIGKHDLSNVWTLLTLFIARYWPKFMLSFFTWMAKKLVHNVYFLKRSTLSINISEYFDNINCIWWIYIKYAALVLKTTLINQGILVSAKYVFDVWQMMPHNTIESALYYIAIFPRKTSESTFRYEIWRKDGIIKTMSYQ